MQCSSYGLSETRLHQVDQAWQGHNDHSGWKIKIRRQPLYLTHSDACQVDQAWQINGHYQKALQFQKEYYKHGWNCCLPGGPNKRTPLLSVARLPDAKSSGYCKGNCTTSLRTSLTGPKAPTSANPLPASSGLTTCMDFDVENNHRTCKNPFRYDVLNLEAAIQEEQWLSLAWHSEL